jgi:hypothetical protein
MPEEPPPPPQPVPQLKVGVEAKGGRLPVMATDPTILNGLMDTPNAAPVSSTGCAIGTQTTLLQSLEFLKVMVFGPPVLSLPVQSAMAGDAISKKLMSQTYLRIVFP